MKGVLTTMILGAALGAASGTTCGWWPATIASTPARGTGATAVCGAGRVSGASSSQGGVGSCAGMPGVRTPDTFRIVDGM